MVELTQAFLTALRAAELHAAAAKPALLSPRLKQSAIAVSVAQLESKPGGFSSYLGIHEGKELYGMRLYADVQLDIISPTALGAGECRAALDRASAVLTQGVAGVSIHRITTHAPDYDPKDDCFRAQLIANCHCWLCAVPTSDESGELEHFILKGALT